MKQKRIFALTLAAALLLGGCSGGLGAEPTVESEVITVTGGGVEAAMEASNARYIKEEYYAFQLKDGTTVYFSKEELDAYSNEEWLDVTKNMGITKELGIEEPSAQELTYQDAANRARDAWGALGYGEVPEWQICYWNYSDVGYAKGAYFDCIADIEENYYSVNVDAVTGQLCGISYHPDIAEEEKDKALDHADEWYDACKYHTPDEKTIDEEKVKRDYTAFVQRMNQVMDSGALLEQAKKLAEVFEIEPLAWYAFTRGAYPPTVTEYAQRGSALGELNYYADLGNGAYWEFVPELYDTGLVTPEGYSKAYVAQLLYPVEGHTLEDHMGCTLEDLQKIS